MNQTVRYAPADIEPKWQARWAEDKAFAATSTPGKDKVLCPGHAALSLGVAAHGPYAQLYAGRCCGAL